MGTLLSDGRCIITYRVYMWCVDQLETSACSCFRIGVGNHAMNCRYRALFQQNVAQNVWWGLNDQAVSYIVCSCEFHEPMSCAAHAAVILNWDSTNLGVKTMKPLTSIPVAEQRTATELQWTTVDNCNYNDDNTPVSRRTAHPGSSMLSCCNQLVYLYGNVSYNHALFIRHRSLADWVSYSKKTQTKRRSVHLN